MGGFQVGIALLLLTGAYVVIFIVGKGVCATFGCY